MPPDNQGNEGLEFVVMQRPNLDVNPPKSANPTPPKSKGIKTWLIWGVVLILLAAFGYLAYQRFGARDQQPEAKQVPNIVVDQEQPDPDSDDDGLNDSEEERQATDPKKPDTDGDGLADGDEINIYASDPLLFDTDQDGFEDGREVARGFSPIENTPEKAKASEIQKWTSAIIRFGLHEPTITTLKVKATPGLEDQGKTYSNTANGWSIEIPAVLAFREQDNGQKVGLFIAGTNPEDPNVLTDPISFDVAVKVQTETLDQWAANQYQPNTDYQKMESREINGTRAIKLTGMPGDACPSDRTFLPKNGMIIIAAWTCNQLSAFGEFYDQVVNSFKFQ